LGYFGEKPLARYRTGGEPRSSKHLELHRFTRCSLHSVSNSLTHLWISHAQFCALTDLGAARPHRFSYASSRLRRMLPASSLHHREDLLKPVDLLACERSRGPISISLQSPFLLNLNSMIFVGFTSFIELDPIDLAADGPRLIQASQAGEVIRTKLVKFFRPCLGRSRIVI
jgi:hypothetical protein